MNLTKELDQPTVTMTQQGLAVNINRAQFALQLKTWRLRQGLTQRQVGQRWGCSRYTIMRAESGKDITWEMAYLLFSRLSVELAKEGKEGEL